MISPDGIVSVGAVVSMVVVVDIVVECLIAVLATSGLYMHMAR